MLLKASILSVATAVVLAGTAPVAAATSLPLNQQPAPRTADGKPDLTGVYGYAAGPARGTPPPPAASGSLPRTPTLKPGADKYRVVRGPDDTGLRSYLLPRSFAAGTGAACGMAR